MSKVTSRDVPSAEKQLEAIHAMLSAGHRAIRLEPHTFVLWGIASTLCLLAERELFMPSIFHVRWQLAVFHGLFIGVIVALAVTLDFRITKRVQQKRDESYPFIQRQIGKCSILLASLGLAVTFAGWYHSWCTVVFVFWLGIVGLILFVHGLFSEQFLGWAGVALLLLAMGAAIYGVPFEGTRWLLIATCGFGLPTLGFLLRPLGRCGVAGRVLCLVGWMAVISAVAFVGFRTAARPSGCTVEHEPSPSHTQLAAVALHQ